MSGSAQQAGGGGATTALSNLAKVAINAALAFAPGSDVDVDLITVGVTGKPRFWWDQATGSFEMNKSLTLPGGSLNVGDLTLSEDSTANDEGFDVVGTFHIEKFPGPGGIAGNICMHEGEEPIPGVGGDAHRIWPNADHELMWQDHLGVSQVIHHAGNAGQWILDGSDISYSAGNVTIGGTSGLFLDPGGDVDCTIFTVDVSYTWVPPLLTYDRSSEFFIWTRPINVSLVGLGNPTRYLNFADGTNATELWVHGVSPEGVIDSDTGALSIDAAAGKLYIKTTDDANTGWEKLLGQTDADLLYEALGGIATHAALPDAHHAAFVSTDADALIATHAAIPGAHHASFLQGDADLLYDATGTAAAAVATHESTYNHPNYDTAYGWGDHSAAGYLTSESDPVFSAWDKRTGIVIGASQVDNVDDERIPYGSGFGTLTTSPNLVYDYVNGRLGVGVGVNPTTKLDIGGSGKFSGTVTASGGNSGQWSTAYGWGNHAGLYEALGGIAAHAAIAAAHHAKYTDAEAIAAIQNEATLRFNQPTTISTKSGGGGVLTLESEGNSVIIQAGMEIRLKDDTIVYDNKGLYLGSSQDYWWEYSTSGTRLLLKSRDIDGIDTEGTILRIQNGTQIVDFLGGITIGGTLDHDGSNVGFYGVAPTAQPAHIADADGTLADLTTKFNTLLAQTAALGLQAAA